MGKLDDWILARAGDGARKQVEGNALPASAVESMAMGLDHESRELEAESQQKAEGE
jgi:hypothetical protein